MRLLKTLAEKDTLETHGYNRIIRKGIGGYMKAFLILEDGTVFDRNQHWLLKKI